MKAIALGLVLLSSSLTCLGAHAQEVCDPVEVCRVLPFRVTDTGHVFTRFSSFPALGKAWRDETGMIWGDIVKDDDGSISDMDHYEATGYCRRIGAQLPSRDDFERLRSYMGAAVDSASGYVPQILPNLYYLSESGRLMSHDFWTSSIDIFAPRHAMYFMGLHGIFDETIRNFVEYYHKGPVATRCVIHSR